MKTCKCVGIWVVWCNFYWVAMEHSFEECLLVGLWQRLCMNLLCCSILLGCNVWEQVFQTVSDMVQHKPVTCVVSSESLNNLAESRILNKNTEEILEHMFWMPFFLLSSLLSELSIQVFDCLCSSYSFLFANMFSLSELKVWRQIGLDWLIKFLFLQFSGNFCLMSPSNGRICCNCWCYYFRNVFVFWN